MFQAYSRRIFVAHVDSHFVLIALVARRADEGARCINHFDLPRDTVKIKRRRHGQSNARCSLLYSLLK